MHVRRPCVPPPLQHGTNTYFLQLGPHTCHMIMTYTHIWSSEHGTNTYFLLQLGPHTCVQPPLRSPRQPRLDY